ncbi:MAG: IS66 family transposase zinc-finger binding domain-containing protein, partial [Lachnospiraceae bacterium]|nr:IS66 family transposase zinc-finger binding domain-containing protein [Lachnospiraceae bacterium]
MKNAERSAEQWQEIISEKDKEIVELRKQVDWFKGQFKLLQSRQFGSSSEKTSEIAEQTTLFNETELLADPGAVEPDLEQITYKRKKQTGKREMDLSKLPVEQVVHELSQEEQVCPVCGKEMHACGHEVVRRELRYIPAQYKVVEHIQTAYSCRNCEKNNTETPVKKSEVPQGLIPGSGIVSPSLLAHILHSKYALALPLYRQEQELRQMDVPVSRQTMANWIMVAHERWFSGLFQ